MSKRAKKRADKSTRTRYPKLQFGPATSWSGFTPTGVSGFNDLQPGVVVRELLQNALDAAIAAGEPTAIVRFVVRSVHVDEIPGCDEYREAFRRAVDSQTRRSVNRTLTDNAQQVVDTIKAALDRERCPVLMVLDNGIGLDATTMDALLSDGTSAKQGAATGSYGNGHMVVIPASDLRYVLYGGIRQDGTRIGAGHAVLASHARTVTGRHRDADGYLIHRFGARATGHLYDYAFGTSVPPLIDRELDNIENEWKHGTAIIVPAFNEFRERETLWDSVSHAAVCSFFAAIHHGLLRIEVEEDGGSVQVLDASTVTEVLKRDREGRRRRSRASLSGERAFRAWETLKTGNHHVLATKLGQVDIHIRYPSPNGMVRVDLCRNGMWIVDKNNIPGFYGKFADRQPFEAVLLVDAGTGAEAHRLIRKAEGPLHNSLSTKLLAKAERKALRGVLEEIRERIREVVPEVGADTYSPDDVMTLEVGGADGPGVKSGRMSFWGLPVEVGRRALAPVLQQESGGDDRPDSEPPETGGSGGRPPSAGAGTGSKRSSRTPQRFSSVAVPTGVGSCAVQLRCAHDSEAIELSLRVDENDDVTCDRLWADERVCIKSARQDGKPISREDFVVVDGQQVAVRLGTLAAGRDHRVDVEYEVPDRSSIAGIPEPVLRVELLRPVAPTGTSN